MWRKMRGSEIMNTKNMLKKYEKADKEIIDIRNIWKHLDNNKKNTNRINRNKKNNNEKIRSIRNERAE